VTVSGEHLGGCVVLYRGAAELDPSDWLDLCEFSSVEAEKELASMYVPGKDPLTGEEGYLNRNGYFFDQKGVECMPRHVAFIHATANTEIKALLNELESTRDECYTEYMDRYPTAAQCVWWKIKGHTLVYPPGSFLGIHSDLSTDYAYGIPHPVNQIATRTVVSTLTFLNDSVDSPEELDGTNFMGGWVQFPYLDISYQPKRGDMLVFPSSYSAAHQCGLVEEGTRYSNVGWLCQGTPNGAVGENVLDPVGEDPERIRTATNVYLTEPLGKSMADFWSRDS